MSAPKMDVSAGVEPGDGDNMTFVQASVGPIGVSVYQALGANNEPLDYVVVEVDSGSLLTGRGLRVYVNDRLVHDQVVAPTTAAPDPTAKDT